MSAHKNQPFHRRLRFACSGLMHGLRTERSLRVQAVTAVLAVIALVMLRPAAVWWALVALAAAGVLAAELFNSALEALADHLHPQLHARIRVVKDYAAAAVLMMVLGALAVAIALILHATVR